MTTEPTVQVAFGATAAFTVIQIAATVAPGSAAAVISLVWSLVLFSTGSAAFLWAFFTAAKRSRDEPVTVAGVVWLIGSAPAATARALRWALMIQVVVAVAAASIRPFSPVAFGVLMPMFGLGCLAWYGARHGDFTRVARSAPSPGADSGDAAGHARLDAGDSAAPVPGSGADRSDPDDFDQLFRRRRKRSSRDGSSG